MNNKQKTAYATSVDKHPRYEAWNQLNEMIVHQANQIIVHHIDTIPVVDLSKWSLRLYTPSLLSNKQTQHKSSTCIEDYKLEPIVHHMISLNTLNDTKIVKGIIDEHGDDDGGEFSYRSITLWRQSRCQSSTTLPSYEPTSNKKHHNSDDDGNDDDKEEEEQVRKAVMGIDDDMCDYLATLWMNQSSLETRSVRVEPYKVTHTLVNYMCSLTGKRSIAF
jgi:hypothetical protein